MYERSCGIIDVRYEETIGLAILRTCFHKIILGILLLFLLIMPIIGISDYVLSILNGLGITIIAVLGLNILTGMCGQINIGQAAFMMVGGYTSAILSTKLGLSFWACVPLSALTSALIGLIFGLPSLRIKGFYIAMSTLAAQYILPWTIIHIPSISGGIIGIRASSPELGGIAFNNELNWYYLILGFTIGMTFISKNLQRSKVGRAFVAIRDNDIAAEIMGINIFRYKVLAFCISSVFAGVSGSLMVHYMGMAHYEHYTLINSIWYLGMIIVGGMGSVTGVIFGVVALKILSELMMLSVPYIGSLLPGIAGGIAAGLTPIIFGTTIIVFIIFEPRGIAHTWEVLKSSMRIWPFPY